VFGWEEGVEFPDRENERYGAEGKAELFVRRGFVMGGESKEVMYPTKIHGSFDAEPNSARRTFLLSDGCGIWTQRELKRSL
jgi:hypothetical protein